jgi:hypothetical protein
MPLLIPTAVEAFQGQCWSLFDPLVGDNQCQLHSLVLYNIAAKNKGGLDTKINDELKSYLARALFLTLARERFTNEVGVCIHDATSQNCVMTQPPSVENPELLEKLTKVIQAHNNSSATNRQKVLADFRSKFAAQSLRLMGDITQDDDVKALINSNKFAIKSTHSTIPTIPFFASTRAFFQYCEEHQNPILYQTKNPLILKYYFIQSDFLDKYGTSLQ